MNKIKLLDCTLRDGGYVNDWLFGHNNIVNIFERLVSAGIDIIEVGFLDERRPYDYSCTIMPDSNAVEKIFKDLNSGNSMLVGMIDYGTCDISNIIPCSESILDGIRVIFKKNLRNEAMEFCGELKELGYKVFAQLVSVTSYTDEEMMDLIRLANAVGPYAVSMVDTYGLMHQENLLHYLNLLDRHLNIEITVGYHSHNNFQMAYANCIEFLTQNVQRDIVIDGTIYGMGKSAGNAPIELLTMYMNQHYGRHYDTSQILEAIDSSVMEFYQKKQWGYNMFYYIAASNDCHPNYVSYLMDKRTLSVQSINYILGTLESEKKLLYDEKYIEQCYIDYQTNEVKDEVVYEQLRDIFCHKSVLLIGPGRSLMHGEEQVIIDKEIKGMLRIAVNFIPEQIDVDYIFLTNAKRYLMMSTALAARQNTPTIIATSNVTSMQGKFPYILNYSTLLDLKASIVDNSLLMLLKVLKNLDVGSIKLAGFDGYKGNGASNYIEQNMEYNFSDFMAEELNLYVADVLKEYGKHMDVHFLTESFYNI